MNAHSPIDTAVTVETGTVLDIPLNKLKKSPGNARHPDIDTGAHPMAAG